MVEEAGGVGHLAGSRSSDRPLARRRTAARRAGFGVEVPVHLGRSTCAEVAVPALGRIDRDAADHADRHGLVADRDRPPVGRGVCPPFGRHRRATSTTSRPVRAVVVRAREFERASAAAYRPARAGRRKAPGVRFATASFRVIVSSKSTRGETHADARHRRHQPEIPARQVRHRRASARPPTRAAPARPRARWAPGRCATRSQDAGLKPSDVDGMLSYSGNDSTLRRPSSPATSASGSTSTWTCSAAARRPRR